MKKFKLLNLIAYTCQYLVPIFAMHTYWYICMAMKNTKLIELLGKQYMKTKSKVVAEELAYMYKKQAQGVLVRVIDVKDLKKQGNETIGSLMTKKIQSFLKGLKEIS